MSAYTGHLTKMAALWRLASGGSSRSHQPPFQPQSHSCKSKHTSDPSDGAALGYGGRRKGELKHGEKGGLLFFLKCVVKASMSFSNGAVLTTVGVCPAILTHSKGVTTLSQARTTQR